MKRTTIITILTCFYAMATAQSFYTGELSKTIGTSYKYPAIGLGYGYKYKIFTSEFGLKTNYNEYYTLLFSSIGVESKGKLLVGVNGGIGINFSIPQLDRQYFPETGETKVISEGYQSKTITSFYGNFKMGYEVLKGVKVYGSYSIGFKNWLGVGIKLTAQK